MSPSVERLRSNISSKIHGRGPAYHANARSRDSYNLSYRRPLLSDEYGDGVWEPKSDEDAFDDDLAPGSDEGKYVIWDSGRRVRSPKSPKSPKSPRTPTGGGGAVKRVLGVVVSPLRRCNGSSSYSPRDDDDDGRDDESQRYLLRTMMEEKQLMAAERRSRFSLMETTATAGVVESRKKQLAAAFAKSRKTNRKEEEGQRMESFKQLGQNKSSGSLRVVDFSGFGFGNPSASSAEGDSDGVANGNGSLASSEKENKDVVSEDDPKGKEKREIAIFLAEESRAATDWKEERLDEVGSAASSTAREKSTGDDAPDTTSTAPPLPLRSSTDSQPDSLVGLRISDHSLASGGANNPDSKGDEHDDHDEDRSAGSSSQLGPGDVYLLGLPKASTHTRDSSGRTLAHSLDPIDRPSVLTCSLDSKDDDRRDDDERSTASAGSSSTVDLDGHLMSEDEAVGASAATPTGDQSEEPDSSGRADDSEQQQQQQLQYQTPVESVAAESQRSDVTYVASPRKTPPPVLVTPTEKGDVILLTPMDGMADMGPRPPRSPATLLDPVTPMEAPINGMEDMGWRPPRSPPTLMDDGADVGPRPQAAAAALGAPMIPMDDVVDVGPQPASSIKLRTRMNDSAALGMQPRTQLAEAVVGPRSALLLPSLGSETPVAGVEVPAALGRGGDGDAKRAHDPTKAMTRRDQDGVLGRDDDDDNEDKGNQDHWHQDRGHQDPGHQDHGTANRRGSRNSVVNTATVHAAMAVVANDESKKQERRNRSRSPESPCVTPRVDAREQPVDASQVKSVARKKKVVFWENSHNAKEERNGNIDVVDVNEASPAGVDELFVSTARFAAGAFVSDEDRGASERNDAMPAEAKPQVPLVKARPPPRGSTSASPMMPAREDSEWFVASEDWNDGDSVLSGSSMPYGSYTVHEGALRGLRRGGGERSRDHDTILELRPSLESDCGESSSVISSSAVSSLVVQSSDDSVGEVTEEKSSVQKQQEKLPEEPLREDDEASSAVSLLGAAVEEEKEIITEVINDEEERVAEEEIESKGSKESKETCTSLGSFRQISTRERSREGQSSDSESDAPDRYFEAGCDPSSEGNSPPVPLAVGRRREDGADSAAGEAKDRRQRGGAAAAAYLSSSESTSGDEAPGVASDLARRNVAPWAKTAESIDGGSVGSDLISAPSAGLSSSTWSEEREDGAASPPRATRSSSGGSSDGSSSNAPAVVGAPELSREGSDQSAAANEFDGLNDFWAQEWEEMATVAAGGDADDGEVDVAVATEDGGLSDPDSDVPFHFLKKRAVGDAMVEEEQQDGTPAIITDCDGNEYLKIYDIDSGKDIYEVIQRHPGELETVEECSSEEEEEESSSDEEEEEEEEEEFSSDKEEEESSSDEDGEDEKCSPDKEGDQKTCILDKEMGDECSSSHDKKAGGVAVVEGEVMKELGEEEGKECRSNYSKKARAPVVEQVEVEDVESGEEEEGEEEKDVPINFKKYESVERQDGLEFKELHELYSLIDSYSKDEDSKGDEESAYQLGDRSTENSRGSLLELCSMIDSYEKEAGNDADAQSTNKSGGSESEGWRDSREREEEEAGDDEEGRSREKPSGSELGELCDLWSKIEGYRSSRTHLDTETTHRSPDLKLRRVRSQKKRFAHAKKRAIAKAKSRKTKHDVAASLGNAPRREPMPEAIADRPKTGTEAPSRSPAAASDASFDGIVLAEHESRVVLDDDCARHAHPKRSRSVQEHKVAQNVENEETVKEAESPENEDSHSYFSGDVFIDTFASMVLEEESEESAAGRESTRGRRCEGKNDDRGETPAPSTQSSPLEPRLERVVSLTLSRLYDENVELAEALAATQSELEKVSRKLETVTRERDEIIATARFEI